MKRRMMSSLVLGYVCWLRSRGGSPLITNTSERPEARMASAIGRSPTGGMSMALMCGMEAGRILLATAQASQLRSGKRMRSGILNALTSGIAAWTKHASAYTSASLRGTSSTEILMSSSRRPLEYLSEVVLTRKNGLLRNGATGKNSFRGKRKVCA